MIAPFRRAPGARLAASRCARGGRLVASLAASLAVSGAAALAPLAAQTPSTPRPAAPAPSAARPAAAIPRLAAITPAEIEGSLRFLASDALQGRAPATPGGRLTTEYIASELMAAGLQPGNDSSFFQTVPIDLVAADTASIRLDATGRAATTLRYPEQAVVWAGSATPQSSARGELVFVGYGVQAPEYRWDDFKGMNLKGKVLLVLVNDPPAPDSEPALFGGKAMTYYGRWTYKFEEAERQGAAGMLIIHTTEEAGYPWHTVVGSWAKEQRMLPRDSTLPPPIGVQGWITDSAATALLRQAGLDLATLRRQAASRDFRPVPTGITMDMSFQNSVQRLASRNVVGVVRGQDPRLAREYVALTTHWDHLGTGPAVNGDTIYNGASDNASGVADMLAIARAAARVPAPRRSLLFVFVTAEESGLLGSAWYARNPTVPAGSIVANVNVDGGNLRGLTRDLRVLGDTRSSLGPQLARMIAPRGMRVSPDDRPERGSYFRSDHFSFAKAGVPSVSVGAGNDYVGRPSGWGAQQDDEYTATRYHQPSDEYRPGLDLRGAAQLSEIVLRFALLVADSPPRPTFTPDSEAGAQRPTTP